MTTDQGTESGFCKVPAFVVEDDSGFLPHLHLPLRTDFTKLHEGIETMEEAAEAVATSAAATAGEFVAAVAKADEAMSPAEICHDSGSDIDFEGLMLAEGHDDHDDATARFGGFVMVAFMPQHLFPNGTGLTCSGGPQIKNAV